MALGMITGPVSGTQALAMTEALNRQEAVQNLINSGDYQGAIDLAIQLYHIDVSQAAAVMYDSAEQVMATSIRQPELFTLAFWHLIHCLPHLENWRQRLIMNRFTPGSGRRTVVLWD